MRDVKRNIQKSEMLLNHMRSASNETDAGLVADKMQRQLYKVFSNKFDKNGTMVHDFMYSDQPEMMYVMCYLCRVLWHHSGVPRWSTTLLRTTTLQHDDIVPLGSTTVAPLHHSAAPLYSTTPQYCSVTPLPITTPQHHSTASLCSSVSHHQSPWAI